MSAEVGFPVELSSKLDYSTPAECSSLDMKVYPSNVQSVVSATQTLASSAITDILMPTTTFNFQMPAGAGKQVFLDPRFTKVNFRVAYEIVSQGATADCDNCVLRSNAGAFFARMWEESQSGVVVNDVPSYDIVSDIHSQFTFDSAQRDVNALTHGFAFESAPNSSQNTNTGHIVDGINNLNPLVAKVVYYSYSVPLLSCLTGAMAKKWFQIGAVSKHTINLQLASVAPLTMLMGAQGTAGTFRISIDNIFISARYITLPMDSLKLIGKVSGLQYYNGITARVSSQSLGKATGTQSWLVGNRGSSVKNIIARFTEDAYTTAGCVNKQFDSKLPQYSSIQYNVNGVNLPSTPDDLLHAPATAYARLQQAMGQFDSYEFKSGLTPDRYCVYAPGGTLDTTADRNIVGAGSASSATALCSFHYAINLERIAKAGILSGMNLNSSNTYLQTYGSNASTNNITAYFASFLDVLIMHDIDSGELSVRL